MCVGFGTGLTKSRHLINCAAAATTSTHVRALPAALPAFVAVTAFTSAESRPWKLLVSEILTVFLAVHPHCGYLELCVLYPGLAVISLSCWVEAVLSQHLSYKWYHSPTLEMSVVLHKGFEVTLPC